ncbi:hypothetical protein BDN72DRAFT_281523 [Pluteus cervinus]|uniref:Uncharacterized protein n=1 Tax=Pluteus cervinus TaxID=181527 RepID=A0ACD3B577_9AGAR|nr:hypothetical protein BDN72DRAFT_281523 [Pluteus cervinus]
MYNLNFNLGAFELGVIVSGVLFGITTSQAYVYYQRYTNDPLRLRILVSVVWFLELCHAVAAFEGFYEVSVLNVGLQKSPIGFNLAFLFSGTVTSLAYFTYRIRVVTERQWPACICWALSTIRFVGTIWLAALLFVIPMEDLPVKWSPLATTVWLIGAFADVVITTSLSVDLIRKRKEAIFGRRILDKIIATTIRLVTSLLTITVAVCFIAMPENLIWAAIGLSLPKIFSISLFASLNARDSLNSANYTYSMHPCRHGRRGNACLLRRSSLDFLSSPSTIGIAGNPV